MSVPLAEYLDYRDRVREDQLLWENNGWSLRGTAGDLEVLAWVSPYLLKGFDGGPFALDAAGVNQSLLVTLDPGTAPPTLHDNDFVAVGWDPPALLPWTAWQVESDGRAVTWRGPDREIVSAPPHWTVTGDHGGVELAVDISALAEPMWLTDPDQDLADRQDRWFIANGVAQGTLRLGGSRLPLSAHAVHERHIHLGTTYDPVTLLRDGGVTWHTGHNDQVSYAVLARPSRGEHWGQVQVRGAEWRLTRPGDIEIDVTSRWCDPRTDLTVPAAWRLRLRGDAGTLELRTTARARAFYRWDFLSGGRTQLYWWLCSTVGTLTGPDGRVEELAPLRSEAHLNRTLDEGTAR